MTITQAILDQIPLAEGDRVLIEAAPPKRIVISREASRVPNTRRTELEIEALEARKAALDSDLKYKAYHAADARFPNLMMLNPS